MTRYTIFLATMLCISLLFSCTSVERDNPFDEKSIDYKPIWNRETQYVFTDSRDGKQYKAIGYESGIEIYEGFKPIWSVVWMVENLNYNASGSKCYDNEETNCTTYGKLYDWETAKTVCPSGWHLPSYEEWRELGVATAGKLSEAGGSLRADHGWGVVCNGWDNWGFSALPGGYGISDNSFHGVGTEGRWWTNNKSSGIRISCYIYNTGEDDVSEVGINKSNFLSVRCVKNN